MIGWCTQTLMPFFRANPNNLSLVRIVGAVAPQISPLIGAVFFFALTLLLYRRNSSSVSAHTLLPAMILTTPLVWSHYIVHTGMLRLTRIEQVLLLTGGGLIFLSSLNLFPTQSAALAYSPVLAALVMLWYRARRDGLALSTRPS